MHKKNITLLAGLVLLAGLTGVYFLLNTYNTRTEEAAEAAASGETILEISYNDVSSLSFTMDDTEYTFTCTDDQWTLEEDPDFQVNSTVLNTAITSLNPLNSLRTLTDVSDTGEYGLDDPQNTITVITSDGSETIITIGDTNNTTSNDYIMLNNDESTIYTVSSSLRTAFSYSLEHFEYVEPETETETETEIETEAETKAKAETEADTEVETKAKAEAEADTEADTEASSE